MDDGQNNIPGTAAVQSIAAKVTNIRLGAERARPGILVRRNSRKMALWLSKRVRSGPDAFRCFSSATLAFCTRDASTGKGLDSFFARTFSVDIGGGWNEGVECLKIVGWEDSSSEEDRKFYRVLREASGGKDGLPDSLDGGIYVKPSYLSPWLSKNTLLAAQEGNNK